MFVRKFLRETGKPPSDITEHGVGRYLSKIGLGGIGLNSAEWQKPAGPTTAKSLWKEDFAA
jgi:hypothetical protein